ncbi:MAG: hypothetical protein QQN41_05075, partial [Nitrosopumilus sp.]
MEFQARDIIEIDGIGKVKATAIFYSNHNLLTKCLTTLYNVRNLTMGSSNNMSWWEEIVLV